MNKKMNAANLVIKNEVIRRIVLLLVSGLVALIFLIFSGTLETSVALAGCLYGPYRQDVDVCGTSQCNTYYNADGWGAEGDVCNPDGTGVATRCFGCDSAASARSCACGGGDGAPTPDTTPPKCGVEIEPSVAGDNLVTNPGFETGSLNPWSGGGEVQSDWKHNGTYAVKGSNYTVSQNIDVNRGAIYKVRVWAKAAHYEQGGEECWGVAELRVDGSGSNQIVRGKYSTSWTKFEGSFVAKDNKMTIELTGDRDGDDCWYDQVAFDDIWVKKIAGADSTPDQAVNLQIGLWDNRGIGQYQIRNKGVTGWGPWTDTSYSDAWDPINWTLSSTYEVEVQVRDFAENKSEICSDTIGFIPPTGTITGRVYQNPGGACTGDTDPPGGWSVTCKHETWTDAVDANVAGSQFQCKDSLGNLQVPYGTYVIDFTSPSGWQLITSASCQIDPTSIILDSPSETLTPPFYLWQGAQAWFQTQGGDAHGQTGISSPVIQGEYFCKNLDNYPGVVSYTGTADFSPGGSASSKGWLANSGFSPTYNYSYFYRKLDSPGTDNFSCEPNCPDPPAGQTTIYYSEDKVTIGGNSWQLGNNVKAIVLINNDLEIGKEITVPVGSFLAFIVKGNINIDGNVGDKQASTANPHLQGVYLADGIIDTYEPDPVGQGSKNRLVGAGLFYASGFNLDRDLYNNVGDPITNGDTPAELFIFRPDLVLNAPRELWFSKMSWLEVAP